MVDKNISEAIDFLQIARDNADLGTSMMLDSHISELKEIKDNTNE